MNDGDFRTKGALMREDLITLCNDLESSTEHKNFYKNMTNSNHVIFNVGNPETAFFLNIERISDEDVKLEKFARVYDEYHDRLNNFLKGIPSGYTLDDYLEFKISHSPGQSKIGLGSNLAVSQNPGYQGSPGRYLFDTLTGYTYDGEKNSILPYYVDDIIREEELSSTSESGFSSQNLGHSSNDREPLSLKENPVGSVNQRELVPRYWTISEYSFLDDFYVAKTIYGAFSLIVNNDHYLKPGPGRRIIEELENLVDYPDDDREMLVRGIIEDFMENPHIRINEVITYQVMTKSALKR